MLTKNYLYGLGCASVLCSSVLFVEQAQAANLTLDWGSSGFQNGQTALQSFGVGGGTVDISFTKTGSIDFVKHGNSGTTPEVSRTLNGSNDPNSPKSLHLQIDGANRDTSSVTMSTIFQGYGGAVSNVAFWLFDVDIAGGSKDPRAWQDEVIIQGFLGDTLINPIFSPFKASVVNVSGNTVNGQIPAPNEKPDGNVYVSFQGVIDRFTLTYKDGARAKTNPAAHGIGIGNISFTKTTPVPEPSSMLGLSAVGALVVGLKGRANRRQDKVS